MNTERCVLRSICRWNNGCLAAVAVLMLAMPVAAHAQMNHRFIDVTDQVGLSSDVLGAGMARCCFVDLDADGWPDAVIDRTRVFLNRPVAVSDDAIQPDGSVVVGRMFVEVIQTGLPALGTAGGVTAYADINNDGYADAIVARYVDANNPKWVDDGSRTAWYPGNGDGSFGPARVIAAATAATTSSIAVGDVDRDGRLDLWLGNWYRSYGGSYEGYNNDLLIQTGWEPGNETDPIFWSWVRSALPSDSCIFDEEHDAAGRPTYGSVIAQLDGKGWPELLELNYGRRWNRCLTYRPTEGAVTSPWVDDASEYGLDGDDIRHGRYPEWLKERASTDARFDRPDELPFRANGNTFDCSVADIDNDGDFDLFISEIAHGWAGESSDRSRFLVNRLVETDAVKFEYDPRLCVDRVPPAPEDSTVAHNWNQGDLFAELADMDLDGRIDLLLSSGDYPDNQRLRMYHGEPDGTFVGVTESVGLDHDGSQQISLADINGDGALDIMVGQTFFRYSAEQRAGREPRLRVYLNQPPVHRKSLVLRLRGRLDGVEGTACNRAGLGAIASVTLDGQVMSRQLIGVGGHAGKQRDFVVHFGLGASERVETLTIVWPDANGTQQVFDSVPAGRYVVEQGRNELAPME